MRLPTCKIQPPPRDASIGPIGEPHSIWLKEIHRRADNANRPVVPNGASYGIVAHIVPDRFSSFANEDW